MQSTLDRRATFSHPKDRSLEAFKAWIMEIAGRLTTDKTILNMTEQEWTENWKEYWKRRPEEGRFRGR